MIELREMRNDELEALGAMDRDGNTPSHITVYSLEEHQREFARDDIVYLSIYQDDRLAGYFILRLEEGADSVEFRRIVVAQKGQGIGQVAITAMECWVAEQLRRERIWLDVFESNPRGQHVYRKLGYQQFKTGEFGGRKLLFMEKRIDSD